MVTENKRMEQKVNTLNGFTPSIGPSSDHTDGSWTSSNIYSGELVVDTYSDVIYYGGNTLVYKMANINSDNSMKLDPDSTVVNGYNFLAGKNNVNSNECNIMLGKNNTNTSAYSLIGGESNQVFGGSNSLIVGSYNTIYNPSNSMISTYSATITGVSYSIIGGPTSVLNVVNSSSLIGWGFTSVGFYYGAMFGQSHTTEDTYWSLIAGENNDNTNTQHVLQVGKQTELLNTKFNLVSGFYNYIESGDYSNIIGGQQNIISGYTNTTMISMTGVTAAEDNSVYVPNVILHNGVTTTPGTMLYDGAFKGLTSAGWITLGGSAGGTASGLAGAIQLSDGVGVFADDTKFFFDGKSMAAYYNSNVLIGKGGIAVTGTLNTALGYEALNSLVGANFNTAIGANTLKANISGAQNTAVGYNAMAIHTTNGNNAAIGANALASSVSSSNNTAVGNYAGQDIVAGSNNALLGYNAGRNTDGTYNTLLGSYAAGNGKLETDNNVVIGYRAGYNLSGDSNVFLGYNAGYSEVGSSKLYIDSTNTDNPLIYGEFDNNLVKINGDLTVTEAMFNNVSSINASTYDLLESDYILNVIYTTSGEITITLPTAQVVAGRTIIIKDGAGNALTNNITIDTEGSEKIDGDTDIIISGDYSSVNIYCDGTNWLIY